MISLSDTINKDLSEFKDYLAIITMDSASYQKTILELLNFYVKEKKMPGVYVTLNKPYDIIDRTLKKAGIDTETIIFIDSASKLGNKENVRIDKCLYVSSLERLSDISVAMEQAVESLPDPKFLIFDSINTLSIFNPEATVSKFVFFLSRKIRQWKVNGMILSVVSQKNTQIIDEITQFSDSRIDVGGK